MKLYRVSVRDEMDEHNGYLYFQRKRDAIVKSERLGDRETRATQ